MFRLMFDLYLPSVREAVRSGEYGTLIYTITAETEGYQSLYSAYHSTEIEIQSSESRRHFQRYLSDVNILSYFLF
jgi:hypothetical protein